MELFQILLDEKEELMLRIDWLHRLYRIKEEVNQVHTIEKVKELRRTLSSVQTCPLKKQLLTELQSIENTFPEEKPHVTREGELMEKAITEIGADFINLGKAGREYVIKEVMKTNGEERTMEQIRNATTTLESNVTALKECHTKEELLSKLETLPLPSFSSLRGDRKEAIAERLLDNKTWNGLHSLERIIQHLNRIIAKEEEEKETITIEHNGKAAVSFCVDNEKNNVVKIV